MIRSSSILFYVILGFTFVWSDVAIAEDDATIHHTVGRFFARNKTYAMEENSVERGVVLLDFYNDACGPCRAMMPAVKSLVDRGYRVSKVNTDKFPGWAERFHITKIPCFVVVIDGQEVARHTGVTSEQKLENMLVQAGAIPTFKPKKMPRDTERIQIATSAWRGRETSVTAQDIVAGRFDFSRPMQPEKFARQIATNVEAELPPQNLEQNSPKTKGFVPVSKEYSRDNEYLLTGLENKTVHITNPSSTTNSVDVRILASAVRIRINDAVGSGCGTGTIIDCRSGHALVLTCGHLFREFKAGDVLAVDVYSDGHFETIPARYVHHDEERDLGLLSFTVTSAIQVSPLAGRNVSLQKGLPIITAGCSDGNDPTLQNGIITNLNRFMGTPNIEVSAVPVPGRSGGGLFTNEGTLIGVCFAADPEDQEGIFTSVEAIYDYLTTLKMEHFVSAPRNESVALQKSVKNEDVLSLAELPSRNNTNASYDTSTFVSVATQSTMQSTVQENASNAPNATNVATTMPRQHAITTSTQLKPAEMPATSLANTTPTVAPIMPSGMPQIVPQTAQSVPTTGNVPITPIPERSLIGEAAGEWPPRWR